jgi:hypothetical protein
MAEIQGHRAPYYSDERTAYFEHLMDGFAERGGRSLTFTPPSTRGSNITRCEAWAINTQRDYVPTLADAGRWPNIKIGAHPETLSRDQTEWLSMRWGECARKWAEAGCPGVIEPTSIRLAKSQKERKEYASLVLSKFRDLERTDKRSLLEKKSAVEHAARQRL